MKSKIRIEIDHDNQPIIRINYVSTDDVRDKLVKKFLESFGSQSCWAKFHFNNETHVNLNNVATIRPICAYDLPEEVKIMQSEADAHLKMRYVEPKPTTGVFTDQIIID